MMVLPFLLVALGLGALFARRPTLAWGLWAAGLVWTLYLFHLHATSPLGLGF